MSPETELEDRISNQADKILDFRAIWTITKMNMTIVLRYPANIVLWGLFPIIWFVPMIFSGYALSGSSTSPNFTEISGYTDFVPFLVVGWFVYIWIDSTIWGIGNSLREEQEEGTLESILLIPTSRINILLGYSLREILITLMSSVVLVGTSVILFNIQLVVSQIIPAIILIGLMLLGFIGMGIMMAGMVILFKSPGILLELFDIFNSTLVPVHYPVSVLPSSLRAISFIIPATVALVGVRLALIKGALTLQTFLSLSFHLIILAVIFWSLGLGIFKLAEKHTRKTGKIGGY